MLVEMCIKNNYRRFERVKKVFRAQNDKQKTVEAKCVKIVGALST